jgi:hypothetical protein
MLIERRPSGVPVKDSFTLVPMLTGRILCFLWAAIALVAQRGTIDVKGSIGYTGFLDDSTINHLQTGASARIYITRRFSIEPEVQYLYQSSRHHDITFVPNLVWDFGGQRIVPYVIGGVGFMSSTFKGPGPGFRNTVWFGEVGGGSKFYLTDQWFVAPEARIGWEPHNSTERWGRVYVPAVEPGSGCVPYFS